MVESIHGHQVMEMIATSKKSYTRALLMAEIDDKFGENIRFHTCMESDLSAEDLICFLVAKGKIVESDAKLSLAKDGIC